MLIHLADLSVLDTHRALARFGDVVTLGNRNPEKTSPSLFPKTHRPSLGDRTARIAQIAFVLAHSPEYWIKPSDAVPCAIWSNLHRMIPGYEVGIKSTLIHQERIRPYLRGLGEAGDKIVNLWAKSRTDGDPMSLLISDARMIDSLLTLRVKGIGASEANSNYLSQTFRNGLHTKWAVELGEKIHGEDPNLWWNLDSNTGDPFVRFFHELGFLATEARRGWRKLNIIGFDSVQEHTASMAQLSHLAALLDELPNPTRIANVVIWHDIHESRGGDPDSLIKRYGTIDERNIIADQCKPLGEVGESIHSRWLEVQDLSTLEGVFAKDFDRIEMAIVARHLLSRGFSSAAVWIDFVRSTLRTDTGKAVFRAVEESKVQT